MASFARCTSMMTPLMMTASGTLCGKEVAREVVKEAAKEDHLLQGRHLLPSGPDEGHHWRYIMCLEKGIARGRSKESQEVPLVDARRQDALEEHFLRRDLPMHC